MLPHFDVRIEVEADLHTARATVCKVAALHNIDDENTGRVALVATELASNLLNHAGGGRLLIGCHAIDDGAQIEVISIDSGPGMRDANRSIRDGRASGSSPSGGLAGVRRLSTDFSIYSVPSRGTVILSRAWSPATHAPNSKSPAARFLHAGVCLAAPGAAVSGDGWAIRFGDSQATVIVSDGNGSGIAAASASTIATATFREVHATPKMHLQRAHEVMAATEGASAAVASLNARKGCIEFAGAGSVACRIVSATAEIELNSQPGRLGRNLAQVQEVQTAWPEHSAVIMHSDGIDRHWHLSALPGLIMCDPAVIAGWLIKEHSVAKEDVAVVVLKRP